MELTREQFQAGMEAGVALTDQNSDAPIPMRHAAGALILNRVCAAVLDGQFALVPVGNMGGEIREAPADPEPEAEDSDDDGD